MTTTTDSSWLLSVQEKLASQAPFSLLAANQLESWFAAGAIRRIFKPGERLLRPDELNNFVYLVLSGEVRLIAYADASNGQISLDKRGSGQLLGWVSLVRGEASEFVQASSEVLALCLPATEFVFFLRNEPAFANYFNNLTNIQEAYGVGLAAAELQPLRPLGWKETLYERASQARVASLAENGLISALPGLPNQWHWYLSTPKIPNFPVGTCIDSSLQNLPTRAGFQLNYRFIALPDGVLKPKYSDNSSVDIEQASESVDIHIDLQQLGILEGDNLEDDQRFPVVRGRGALHEALAVTEMLSLEQQVPFRRDAIQKVLEDQFRRDKGLSLELLAYLSELLGMNSQLAETPREHINSIEAPALFFLDDIPVIFHGIHKGKVVIAHPHHGIQKLKLMMFYIFLKVV